MSHSINRRTFIGDDLAGSDSMPRSFQELDDQPAPGIRLEGASVAHRNDTGGDGNRPGLAVMVLVGRRLVVAHAWSSTQY